MRESCLESHKTVRSEEVSRLERSGPEPEQSFFSFRPSPSLTFLRWQNPARLLYHQVDSLCPPIFFHPPFSFFSFIARRTCSCQWQMDDVFPPNSCACLGVSRCSLRIDWTDSRRTRHVTNIHVSPQPELDSASSLASLKTTATMATPEQAKGSAPPASAPAGGGGTADFIGALISLVSRSDIRYQGFLAQINAEQATVALEKGEFHAHYNAWIQQD